MAIPTNRGYGPKKSRHCYKCGRKRLSHLFSGPIHGQRGFALSPHLRVPLCQPCAVELYGLDRIEGEIAMGRLSWKSQRPVISTPTQKEMEL